MRGVKHLLGRALVVLLPAALSLACSGPVTRGNAKKGGTATSPITLADGHKFLERIDGDRVVLRRQANGRSLPFTDSQFLGKNLVVHPTDLLTDDGVFARVTKVEPGTDTITLTVRALDLAEVAHAARDGDDTLTIHRNPQIPELPRTLGTSTGGGGTKTQSFDPFDLDWSVKPQTEDDTTGTPSTPSGATWPPSITSFLGLNQNVSGYGNVTFDEATASFTPGLSAKWLDDGVELGADMKLETHLKLAFKAGVIVGAPVYETVNDSKLLVIAKGGPVKFFEAPMTIGGIYSTVGVKGSIACYGRVEQKFSGSLDVSLGANLSGSVLVRITKEKADDPTFQEGSIPFDVGGHADARFDADIDSLTPSIYCEVPRLIVYVQPGGRLAERLGGPTAYVGMATKFTANFDDGPAVKVQAFAGVNAEPLGKTIGAEYVLYTWTP